MNQLKLLCSTIVFAMLSALSAEAQIAVSETKHFEKNGLEFDYPAAWKMTEGSNEESEYAELATEGKTVQLVVQWQFGAVLKCEVESTRTLITRALADRVAAQIHATTPLETAWQKTSLGNLSADEIQLRGLLNNNPVTADVLSFFARYYFINLIYLSGSDERGKSAWETIRTTLKLTPPVRLARGKKSIEGGVLNGKAIRLVEPSYPPTARAAHADGTVVIQVLIDEQGNVIEICPLSGHPLLLEAAVRAARQSKFSTTKLSGKPIRVTGIIQYNFVRF